MNFESLNSYTLLLEPWDPWLLNGHSTLLILFHSYFIVTYGLSLGLSTAETAKKLGCVFCMWIGVLFFLCLLFTMDAFTCLLSRAWHSIMRKELTVITDSSLPDVVIMAKNVTSMYKDWRNVNEDWRNVNVWKLRKAGKTVPTTFLLQII